MILLSTFSNEMEAELLASRLKAASIDYKLQDGQADGFRLYVFEDDLEEAREILDSTSTDDDFGGPSFDAGDVDLDEFEG